MFYEERLINGQLWCRSDPQGKWELVSNERLVQRIRDLRYALELAHGRLLTFQILSEDPSKNLHIPTQQDLLPRLEQALANERHLN